MQMKEFEHYFYTWEGYPHVFYFQSRYIDLHTRFTKVIKALPERFFINCESLLSRLEDMRRCLGNFLQVTIIGEEDINPKNLVASEKALDKHTYQPDSSSTQYIRVYVCHVKVQDLNEVGVKDTCLAANHLSTKLTENSSKLHFVLIFCETNGENPQDEVDSFRSKLQQTVEENTNISAVDILVGPIGSNIQTSISNSLEKEIMDRFGEIFTYLQRFMRKDIRYNQESMNVLESEIVVNEFFDFLRNRQAVVDAKILKEGVPLMDIILERLCGKILCACVSPMAIKYNLPDWVCHELIDELNFNKMLRESISDKTLYHLKKFEENVHDLERSVAESKTCEDYRQTHSYDFLMYMLQKDMGKAVTSVEVKLSAMNRITIVMRKMIFEIRGYMKQATVTFSIAEIGQREITMQDITDELKQAIIRAPGVYGMGTLFGQLEIHLQKEMEDSDVKEVKKLLAETMKRYHFAQPYIVRAVENDPKPLVKTFFEQGDKLRSSFPDNQNMYREGTLGCTVKGNDGLLYGLTCAHVVDPHKNDVHEVYIIKQGQKLSFATSMRRLIYYGSAEENGLNLIDFAAIQVLKSVEKMCSCHLKDEFGSDKPGRISQEPELVGSYVYKYGANTDLTHGVIASNDFIFGRENNNDHVLIVEPLPKPSADISGVFANEGSDSRPNSQTPDLLSGCLPTSDNDPDITDMLVDTNDEPLTNEGISDSKSDQTFPLFDCSSDAGKCSNCIQLKDLQPRLEITVNDYKRDSEIIYTRNLNEIQSSSLLKSAEPFAEQGDSGSIICKRDVLRNEIVAIAMITAGDYTLKDNFVKQIETDSKKCVTVRLDKALTKLREKSEIEFNMNCDRDV